MSSIIILGKCPSHIIAKAEKRIESKGSQFRKKLSGLPSYYAIRVNQKYRILLSRQGAAMLCSHARYDKEISQLRRLGG